MRKPDASAAAAVGALLLRNHVVVCGHYLGILGPYTPQPPTKKRPVSLGKLVKLVQLLGHKVNPTINNAV